MDDFLKNRGVTQEAIKRLHEDGIDEIVIATMTTDQLNRYLPRYGDCIAAIAYAKKITVNTSFGHGSVDVQVDRKQSLRNRLFAKLQGKNATEEHFRRSLPQEGNKNAKKITRKVEIGWLHKSGTHPAKQVRSPSGGGTRTINIDIKSTVSDLLIVAKDLFFPCGVSKKGRAEIFKFNITDQTQELLEGDKTIENIFVATKFKTLRFYLLTSTEESERQTQSDKGKLSIEQPQLSDKQPQSSNKQLQSSDLHIQSSDKQPQSSDLQIQSSDKQPQSSDLQIQSSDQQQSSEIIINAASLAGIISSDSECGECCLEIDNFDLPDIPSLEADCVAQISPAESMETADLPMLFPPETIDTCQIRLHRALLKDEMLVHFKNPEIISRNIKFSFVNENGQDADGVSRDAYAGFWDSFFLRHTDGEIFRVPVLANEFSQDEWESVGRILLKGYKDHNYFPVRFAPAFTVAVIHGEDAVSPQVLKESFLNYLSQFEKDVFEAASSGLPHDEDELLAVLDRFECQKIPNEAEMSSVLIQIAHKTLIQQPKYALDSIRNVSASPLKILLPDIQSIIAMYDRLNPTIAKVVKLLKATPATKEENSSFGYLKRFIQGRNLTQLKQLLKLLTGSDVICVDEIEITFVVRHGTGRIPSIHTCGPCLELPSTYVSFPDFRSEWESIMESKQSMEMTIA